MSKFWHKSVPIFSKIPKLYTNTKNPFKILVKHVFLFQTSYNMPLYSQIGKIHYNVNEHYCFNRFSAVGPFQGRILKNVYKQKLFLIWFYIILCVPNLTALGWIIKKISLQAVGALNRGVIFTWILKLCFSKLYKTSM